MYLLSLQLNNFRNAEQRDYRFEAPVVALTGRNGVGKTNVLDALHYVCLTRSYFNNQDQQLIRFGQEYFNITAEITDEGEKLKVFCAYQPGSKKVIKLNGNDYPRLADHIGRFPVVMIAPTDLNLIHEGSDERRRFIDMLLSQTDRDYLIGLMKYNKLLLQRNALLKSWAQERRLDKALLEVLDEQLAPLNRLIYTRRAALLDQFNPVFEELHLEICQGHEKAGIQYDSVFHQGDAASLMRSGLQADLDAGRSLTGTHRDEFVFTIDGQPVKKFGSQGQQKSFIVALKLAQSDYLGMLTGKAPFLLLDDVFEKLDPERVANLLRLVSQERFGQILLTDTDRGRVEAIFRNTGAEVQYIAV